MELLKCIPDQELECKVFAQALSEIQDWGLVSQGVPDAWMHSTGKDIIVAVLDTGYFAHSDLRANQLPPIDCTGSDVNDGTGHGTHVSGIIAAAKNDMGIVGVAPDAKILPIKVLDGRGCGALDWIVAGVRKAIENNVDIINMSLGLAQNPGSDLENAIEEAAAKGIIVVAAAGNDSGNVNYPAAYNNVIAVAAVDQNKSLAKFSSRGQRVNDAAPGVNIYSTYLNDGYAVLNGTSQASPFIAGIVALLLSYYKAQGTNEYHNYTEMLKLLDEMGGDDGTSIVHDGQYTYGVPSFANFKPWKS